MELVETVGRMKEAVAGARAAGQRVVALVPTMGAIHEGHLSLARRARRECDFVVASLFVNPKQFGPGEDLGAYPRDLQQDQDLLAGEGVNVLFAPEVGEVYPEGYTTHVEVSGLGEVLCGRSRPGHFRGVTTVVLKLFNVVAPERAYFGQKDYQQAAVLRRMVRDLNLDVELVVCPISREADGLARSSRNRYLDAEERRAATVLYRALEDARARIEGGGTSPPDVVEAMERIFRSEATVRLDYAAVVDPVTLAPLESCRGECLVAVAAFVGRARLIDNVLANAGSG